tara:strand:- start:3287 stop:3535 length:249 start_codon:yes stop_codon:yes gene_type:complete
MDLNKRELAWQKQKEKKVPKYLQKRKSIVIQNKKWRKETAEEFREKYGAWWIFAGLDIRHQKKNKNWVMQYWKGRSLNASEE